MAYGESQVIKERSGVSANDLENVQNSSDLDNLISNLQDRAKSLIDEYCGRDFEEHTGDTVTMDGNGRQTISLRRHSVENEGVYFPIINISSVKVFDDTLDADDYRIKPGASSLSDRNAGIIERKRSVWPEGWESVEVTLDWGFQSPPEDIKSVEESLVVDQLLNAIQADKSDGAESISMDGYSVSFKDRMRLAEEHKTQLQPFKLIHKA